jgi:hypothetical protein
MDQYGGVLTVQLREITPVPEPSTIALLSLAAGALFILARRRRRQT